MTRLALFTDLRAFIRDHEQQLGHPDLVERTATAPSNIRMSEALRTALARSLVHAPHDQLLEDELRHLEMRNGKVGHPTRGPVQTDDVAVASMNVVDHLIGDHNRHDIIQALGEGHITGSQPNRYSDAFDAAHQRTHGDALPRGYSPSADRGAGTLWPPISHQKRPEAARSGQTKAISDVSVPSRSVHFFFIEPG